MYSSYSTLWNSCSPQTSANTDNTKYVQATTKLFAPISYNIVENQIPRPELLSKKQPEYVVQPQCSPNQKTWKQDPKMWGPHLWYYLHCSAANYPEKPTKEQVEAMKTWLCSLSVTMPCKDCGQHFNRYIEQNRVHLDEICGSKTKLFNFLVDIHNKVNKRTNKQQLSYQEAKQLFLN